MYYGKESEFNIIISGYRLIAMLGRGGFGTVFLALNQQEILVAVKILHNWSFDPEKRSEREIRILRERSNQNTVKILDHGTNELAENLSAARGGFRSSGV